MAAKVVTIGIVVGIAGSIVGGCASQQGEPQPTSASAPRATGDGEAQRFRRWLARENGWTQRQRLDRIERDWVPRLQTLPASERAELAAAIEDAITSPRLDAERNRVIDRVLTTDTQVAKR